MKMKQTLEGHLQRWHRWRWTSSLWETRSNTWWQSMVHTVEDKRNNTTECVSARKGTPFTDHPPGLSGRLYGNSSPRRRAWTVFLPNGICSGYTLTTWWVQRWFVWRNPSCVSFSPLFGQFLTTWHFLFFLQRFRETETLPPPMKNWMFVILP